MTKQKISANSGASVDIVFEIGVAGPAATATTTATRMASSS